MRNRQNWYVYKCYCTSVVLNLISTGPHYGPSASLTGRTRVIYILRHNTNQQDSEYYL